MAINSRNKGAAGERELSKKFQELFGCSARRGQQFSGSPDSPDIVTSIPGIHVECKRVEKLNIYAAIQQSKRDAGADEIPVVCFRKNREKWILAVELDSALKFSETMVKFRKDEGYFD